MLKINLINAEISRKHALGHLQIEYSQMGQ